MKLKIIIIFSMFTPFLLLAEDTNNPKQSKSIPEIFESIVNEWAITLEYMFFQVEKRVEKRNEDYTSYINELTNVEEHKLVKDRAIEILETLKNEDKRFSKQIELIQKNITELKEQEITVHKTIKNLQSEKEALKATSDKYLNALWVTIFTIFAGFIALIQRLYVIGLEKKNLIMDLKLKELDFKLKEDEINKLNPTGSLT